MIRKILLCVSVLLMMSCGSKHKLVQEEIKKTEISEEEATRSLSSFEINKDTLNENNEWVWEPADTTCVEPAEIITPDGTKIKIPKKGVLRHNKKSTHSNTSVKKENVVAAKKTTASEIILHKREKNVKREPSIMSFWWIWLFLVLAILIWLAWRRQ